MSRRTRLYRRHRKDKIDQTAASILAQHAHKGQKPMTQEKAQRLALALHLSGRRGPGGRGYGDWSGHAG